MCIRDRVYVDDCAIVGPEQDAWKHIADIGKLMEIKIIGELSKFNGAHYTMNRKEGQLFCFKLLLL